ncbi:MAG: class I SAM-dependent methyltransferase [Vicingaceae bacterium]
MTNCLFCGSANSKTAFELEDIFKDRYQWRVCQNCRTEFLSPQPTDQQLSNAYDTSYYGEGEKKFIPLVEAVVDFFRRRNAKALAAQFGHEGRVLDIGCGNGNLLHYLGKEGAFELHGIEPEGKSAERAAAHREINLHKGYLEKGRFQENHFDAISLVHVFEHLPNPKEALEIIDDILKPGGQLLIEIPNISSWQAKIFKSNWLHLDPPRHLQLTPPELLIKELEKQGYKLINESYFSPQFNPFGVQQSILNWLLPDREVLYEALKGNNGYVKNYSSFSLLVQKAFHWGSFPLFVLSDILASLWKSGGTAKMLFQKLNN